MLFDERAGLRKVNEWGIKARRDEEKIKGGYKKSWKEKEKYQDGKERDILQ